MLAISPTQRYLAENPDVAEAVAKGVYRSGFEHFLKAGYLQGRDRTLLAFDEEAYLAANPDVAAAVAAGTYRNGFDHFLGFGRFESRAGVVRG